MSFEMTDIAQTLTVYNLRADTAEFIGAGQAYIAAHTGLPANCTTVAPPAVPDNKAAVYDAVAGTWSLVDDYRGQTVYDTTTGLAEIVIDLGSLATRVTLTAPTAAWQKWDGTAWVTDADAEKAAQVAEASSNKASLMSTATAAIAPLQDAVDLSIATDDEKTQLTAWKQYRVSLNRVDTATAPDITWPSAPSTADTSTTASTSTTADDNTAASSGEGTTTNSAS